MLATFGLRIAFPVLGGTHLDGFPEVERQFPLLGFDRLVGAHDALHQWWRTTSHILKVTELDAFHAVKHIERIDQAGLLRVAAGRSG